MSPNVQIIATPVPFSGFASGCAFKGTRALNSGVTTSVPNSGWKRGSSGCATSATQAGSSSGRVVSISMAPPSARVKRSLWYAPGVSRSSSSACATAVRKSTSQSVGRFELVGDAAGQQPQERALRHPLARLADGGVGHRPVHREAQRAPQLLEGLLVFRGQPLAQLDEVRTRDRDRVLARLVRRRERRVVRQGRIAADAEVVLHPPLGRQAVVVPSHGIEDFASPHAVVAREDVGVGVGEDVADVQRAADRGRRRVDGIDLARARPSDRTDKCRRHPSEQSTWLPAPRGPAFPGVRWGFPAAAACDS